MKVWVDCLPRLMSSKPHRRPYLGRAEVFRAIIRQEVSFFDEAEVGVLTSRLGSDCHAVARAAATNINVALRNALQCIGGPLPTSRVLSLAQFH